MLKKIQITLLLLFTLFGFTVGGVYFYNPQTVTNIVSSPPLEEVQAQQHVADPAKITIPKLDVEANIELVGEDENGRMGTPQDYKNAGWWQYGAKPGEVGSAVIAGHVDTPDGQLGIFYKLDQLEPGDRIIVHDQDGVVHTFEVVFVQIYEDDEFPVDVVFERSDTKRLNLITCSGNFILDEQNYEDRLVVFAEAIE